MEPPRLRRRAKVVPQTLGLDLQLLVETNYTLVRACRRASASSQHISSTGGGDRSCLGVSAFDDLLYILRLCLGQNQHVVAGSDDNHILHPDHRD